jgi:hypothetical protein
MGNIYQAAEYMSEEKRDETIEPLERRAAKMAMNC